MLPSAIPRIALPEHVSSTLTRSARLDTVFGHFWSAAIHRRFSADSALNWGQVFQIAPVHLGVVHVAPSGIMYDFQHETGHRLECLT